VALIVEDRDERFASLLDALERKYLPLIKVAKFCPNGGATLMFNPFKKKPFEIDDFAKLVITELGIADRRVRPRSWSAKCADGGRATSPKGTELRSLRL
jgi:hypothetical protein